MNKYTITIEETITQDFEVESETAESAMELAEKKYKEGVFILAPGEVQFKQMAITEPSEYSTEWIEF